MATGHKNNNGLDRSHSALNQTPRAARYGAFPKPHVIPTTNHKSTIILLHGRGSSSDEFAEELFEGQTSRYVSLKETFTDCGVKWVFPGAYKRKSPALGEELREWFDVASLENPEEEPDRQVAGIRESIAYVKTIIEEEKQLIHPDKIFLGGISQGYAVASLTLLSLSHALGGFIGVSGWIPFRSWLDQRKDVPSFFGEHFKIDVPMATEEVYKTPVLLTHSQDDSTVDVALGQSACDALQALDMDVSYKEFEVGQHWFLEPECYDEIENFLRANGAA